MLVKVPCSDSDFEPGSELVQPKLSIFRCQFCRIFFFVFPSEEELKQGLQCLGMGSEA